MHHLPSVLRIQPDGIALRFLLTCRVQGFVGPMQACHQQMQLAIHQHEGSLLRHESHAFDAQSTAHIAVRQQNVLPEPAFLMSWHVIGDKHRRLSMQLYTCSWHHETQRKLRERTACP